MFQTVTGWIPKAQTMAKPQSRADQQPVPLPFAQLLVDTVAAQEAAIAAQETAIAQDLAAAETLNRAVANNQANHL
jgi:hypothetical protein